jgi:hypothetical protein
MLLIEKTVANLTEASIRIAKQKQSRNEALTGQGIADQERIARGLVESV